MNAKTWFGLISFVVFMPLVFGQTAYKCEVNGRITFQQHPCIGTPSTEINVDTRDTGNGGMRAGEAEMLMESRSGRSLANKAMEKNRVERALTKEPTSPPVAKPAATRPITRL